MVLRYHPTSTIRLDTRWCCCILLRQVQPDWTLGGAAVSSGKYNQTGYWVVLLYPPTSTTRLDTWWCCCILLRLVQPDWTLGGAAVSSSVKYPALFKMVSALMSCFYGPQLEGSFSMMSNIVNPSTTRMNVATHNVPNVHGEELC